MIFVSVWFYYLPILVMVGANVYPIVMNKRCQNEVSKLARYISGVCSSPTMLAENYSATNFIFN